MTCAKRSMIRAFTWLEAPLALIPLTRECAIDLTSTLLSLSLSLSLCFIPCFFFHFVFNWLASLCNCITMRRVHPSSISFSFSSFPPFTIHIFWLSWFVVVDVPQMVFTYLSRRVGKSSFWSLFCVIGNAKCMAATGQVNCRSRSRSRDRNWDWYRDWDWDWHWKWKWEMCSFSLSLCIFSQCLINVLFLLRSCRYLVCPFYSIWFHFWLANCQLFFIGFHLVILCIESFNR